MIKPTLFAIAVLLYSVWNAWNAPPLAFPFLLWCLPLLLAFLLRKNSPGYAPLLIAAIVLSLIGTIGEVKIARQLGLACALASFIPPSLAGYLWLLSAIAWSPSSTWIFIQFTTFIETFRYILLLIPILWLGTEIMKKEK